MGEEALMEIDPDALPPRERYALLIGLVVPRPIAWVSTLDESGNANLAPFSFFGGVSSDPPMVMVSVGRRRGGRKDTAANLLATREAVVHVPTRPLAERMVATSAEVEAGVDEFDLAGLTKAPSRRVRPWRVAEAAIAMEAVLDRHLEVGNGPSDLFLLRVVFVHLEEAFGGSPPDPALLRAVGRLGGRGYCDTSSPFEIPRPHEAR
jgi:flavin reductase (DIM6/NTAB) family NADH-FMN oxidoreductase RutF